MAQHKSNGLTILLGLLCLVFLATSIWLYMSRQPAGKATSQAGTPVEKLRNADEVKLQDAIDAFKGDTLVLSDTSFKKPIVLTDTLHIDHDTLYIRVKGDIVLQRDTSYKGPALSIGKDSRVIVLENFKFEGFDVAIDLQNTAFSLKNTQFMNCRLPVQRKYELLADKPVTADFPATKVNPQTAKSKTPAKPNGAR